MIYGKKNEQVAIQAIEKMFCIKINKCGIFIDAEEYFLGASPDGLIDGSKGIVEVKCPESMAGIEIKNVKLPFLCRDKNSGKILGLKKQHPYFYQIQGQLHISGREYCIFAVWTGLADQQFQDKADLGKFLYTENIWYDPEFFNKMLPILKEFYFEWLLPEIVDSRYKRKMPVRTNPINIDIR